MAYSDFTLDTAVSRLGIQTDTGQLFPGLQPLPVPSWLGEILSKRTALALISEKARSEFIVVPILLAGRELSCNRLAIFSGQRLDIDPEQGLIGECDFILALAPPVLPMRAPIITLVEAKKNDVEQGLGQCIAQMVAAQRFNRNAGMKPAPIFGCVTTGEIWQFLRLEDALIVLDEHRHYLDDVGGILAAFQSILAVEDAILPPESPNAS
jgi:hypothetical protein